MWSRLGRQKMKDSGPAVSVMRWSRWSRSEWVAVWCWAARVWDFCSGAILTRFLDVEESEGSGDEDHWTEEVCEL